jgi:hypothetical protein
MIAAGDFEALWVEHVVGPQLRNNPRIRAAAKVIHDAGRFHRWSGFSKPYRELDQIGLEEFNAIVASALEAADKVRGEGEGTKVVTSLDPTPTTVQLEATGVRFLSSGDEDIFFARLQKLSFVEKCEGRARTLYVLVNFAQIDEEGLRELLALFRRYGISLRQFAIFDREEFAAWFRNEQAYWYGEVFGRN